MYRSNKRSGNHFEREICEVLAARGFWVHNLAQNSAGQPADIIAVREGVPYLIDCKVCSNERFSRDRIEENQRCSMTLWESCGNGNGWFAIKLKGEIIMISLAMLLAAEHVQLDFKGLLSMGYLIDEWFDEVVRL